jgi:hypothetical protein
MVVSSIGFNAVRCGAGCCRLGTATAGVSRWEVNAPQRALRHWSGAGMPFLDFTLPTIGDIGQVDAGFEKLAG